VLEELQSTRLTDGTLVPQFVLQPDAKESQAKREDPMHSEVEDQLSARHWLKAATIDKALSVRDKLASALGSQVLAREKKRKRIFDRSIEDTLSDD
jgi:hypothetical protein